MLRVAQLIAPAQLIACATAWQVGPFMMGPQRQPPLMASGSLPDASMEGSLETGTESGREQLYARPPCEQSAAEQPQPQEQLTPQQLQTGPPQPVVADRLIGTGSPTVWSEFGEIALSTGALNLGQGFPDWQPPEFVVEQAHAALREGVHQYTRPAGHPALVEVLARRYSKHLERTLEPMTEVAVTVGASQALYLTLQALLNPGDEVLLPEPAFDLYYGQVRLAGGVVRPVALRVNSEMQAWKIDLEALEAAAASGRPKLLILNSPHNPTGTGTGADLLAAIHTHPHPSTSSLTPHYHPHPRSPPFTLTVTLHRQPASSPSPSHLAIALALAPPLHNSLLSGGDGGDRRDRQAPPGFTGDLG